MVSIKHHNTVNIYLINFLQYSQAQVTQSQLRLDHVSVVYSTVAINSPNDTNQIDLCCLCVRQNASRIHFLKLLSGSINNSTQACSLTYFSIALHAEKYANFLEY